MQKNITEIFKLLEEDMKYFLILVIFIIISSLQLKSQSDTLVITLMDGQHEKIAVSQIQKIQFENIVGIEKEKLSVKGLLLKDNHPNPFREQTSIEFEIASYGTVEVLIYDNSGNQIQKLECSNCRAGKNTIQWNCTDKNNNRVQSGVYYYEVRFSDEIQFRKMIIIK